MKAAKLGSDWLLWVTPPYLALVSIPGLHGGIERGHMIEQVLQTCVQVRLLISTMIWAAGRVCWEFYGRFYQYCPLQATPHILHQHSTPRLY